MNKKGYWNIVAGVALFVIFLLILGWYNYSAKSQEKIEAEKLKGQKLQGQLYETQTDLNEANKIIQNQSGQINQLNIEITQYKNSYGVFPLFWLTNIKITNVWAIILNVSLFSFSLITIKFILQFGGQKRRG